MKKAFGVELIRGEEVIDNFHPSFLRFLIHYFFSLLFIGLGIYSYFIGIKIPALEVDNNIYLIYSFGIGGVWLFLTLVANFAETLIITNERVIYKKGVFNINIVDVDVDKIQNTKVRQSFFERIFNYGKFSIDTSGSHGFEVEFEGVPNISKRRAIVKSVIESNLDAFKEKKKRVKIEKKLEKKEKKLETKDKLLDKLKTDIKDLEREIKKK